MYTNLCILLASKTVVCQQIEHCRVSGVTIVCLAQQLQALTIALQHRAATSDQNIQLHQHALVADSKEHWMASGCSTHSRISQWPLASLCAHAMSKLATRYVHSAACCRMEARPSAHCFGRFSLGGVEAQDSQPI